MDKLIEYLREQQAEWLCILNERYSIDGDTSVVYLEEFAKGKLEGYTETLFWIEEEERKQNEKLTEETGRIGKKPQSHGGGTYKAV